MDRSRQGAGFLVRVGLAAAITVGLALSGCSPATKEAAKQAGQSVGEAAKIAAQNTSQATLAAALTPVLDLLNKAEGEVKAGNVAGAAGSMSSFQALWATAAPVIEPIAGDKWPAIASAAQLVLDTFGSGAPTASKAETALTGLLGTLNTLRAK